MNIYETLQHLDRKNVIEVQYAGTYSLGQQNSYEQCRQHASITLFLHYIHVVSSSIINNKNLNSEEKMFLSYEIVEI